MCVYVYMHICIYIHTHIHESESRAVMSDSLQPHGLYSPWNSLGQNTGVGGLSLLQWIFPTQGSNLGLPHCWQIFLSFESPGKPRNTRVGSLSLLQQISPTQESNLGLLRCRQILYQLSHKGSPRILEWIASPFSSGSPQPRNPTWVSCITGRFFTV